MKVALHNVDVEFSSRRREEDTLVNFQLSTVSVVGYHENTRMYLLNALAK